MADGRVVITGAGGQLGRQLVSAFKGDGYDVIGLDHPALNLEDPSAPTRLAALAPAVVVNAAAWTDVDGCARDPDRAMRINGLAPGRLAAAVMDVGAIIVQVSTNEVFDGKADAPYSETDATHAINPYSASKLAGEEAVAAAGTDHLIVRTAWIFGPGGTNFPTRIVAAARRVQASGQPLMVVADEFGNPTWAPDLAAAIVHALDAGARGILHLAGEPAASRYDWTQAILGPMQGLEIKPISQADFPRPAPVPPRAVLSMERARGLGIAPLDWREPSAAYAAELLADAT